ncbi:acetamidase/formamidase family protein [Noviherbaspirillum denitrificans]|uniref:Acetamidase n=1 Tax=Noviherbaspirillum denitrificans TaxID=1968433 RepID=A0A254TL05_9BURK|nr:acetamidase/formamidase family protein [Noviherbaspirillum denitrificans]OWW20388.1 acetamidase [Noviherbaspirillum denitrificans]
MSNEPIGVQDMQPLLDKAADRIADHTRLSRRAVLAIGAGIGLVPLAARAAGGSARGGTPVFPANPKARVHVVECSHNTVRVGILDPKSEPAAVIDSGDIVHYPNTWLNWANEPKYGMSFDEREPIRRRYPNGPYSNIGPVFIRGAEPGDVIECRILRARPIEWGWNSSPANVGAIPEDFDKPYLRYFKFDKDRKTTEFAPGVRFEIHAGQGLFATQPPGDAPVSGILNGPYGGKLGLNELVEGTSLFLPVFQPGGRVWTGNSHAVQGDGMVNQTALETAMEDLRIQYVLHKNLKLALPMAETPTHWIGLGFGATLDDALVQCLRNLIDWGSQALSMERSDVYALFSLAGSFRATKFARQRQSVYTNKPLQTMHGMLPKDVFSPERQARLSQSLRTGNA